MQVLSPGVQHAEEADLGAEMLGVGGDLQQRRGAGAEQQIVEHASCSARPAEQFVGQREDDVEVAAPAAVLGVRAASQRSRALRLALRAVPVAAGVDRRWPDGRIADTSIADDRRAPPCGSARWRAAP